MARVITVDFTGAPPASGGGGQDYVPPGQYTMRVVEVSDAPSKAGKKMLTFTFEVANGDYQGKKLVDRFVLEGDSKFPLQRLHAFVIALMSVPEQTGKVAKLDLDKMVGKACNTEVRDEIQPAQGNYPERTNSRIVAFYGLQSTNGATPTAAPVAAAPVAAAAVAEPVADDVAEVVQEIDDLFK